LGGFFLFFLIIVATDGTHGIVKIVEDAAVGTGALGQFTGLVLVGSKGALSVHIGAVEFQLAAAAAAVDVYLQCTGDQIGQIAQDTAGLTELQFFPFDMVHLIAAARALHRHYDSSLYNMI
jgi:hypothetical protein